MIRFILEARRKIMYWLWQRGLVTFKQSYGNHNRKVSIPITKAIIPLRGRFWFFLGMFIGYIPYIVHMQGWLK